MGKFEIIGIAVFVVIGLLFFLAESESIPEKVKRYIALSTIVMFVGGVASLFLVDDKLGDWAKPVDGPQEPAKKKKMVVALDQGGNVLDQAGVEVIQSGGNPANEEDDGPNPDDFQTMRDCDQCPLMVVLPAGSFMMGATTADPDHRKAEMPQRPVKITRPFAIGRFEILRQEFEAFANNSGYAPTQTCMVGQKEKAGASFRDPGFKQDGRHPAACVTRRDALAYLNWLSRKAGAKYRLPSEAEWEYAARAEAETPYMTGFSLGEAAHWGATDGTRPGGSFPRNKYSLFDVHGNVAELVEDCWHEGFRGAPYDGRPWTGMTECPLRVLKGGAWYDDAPSARLPARVPVSATIADYGIGFRAARDVD